MSGSKKRKDLSLALAVRALTKFRRLSSGSPRERSSLLPILTRRARAKVMTVLNLQSYVFSARSGKLLYFLSSICSELFVFPFDVQFTCIVLSSAVICCFGCLFLRALM
jgi:hypothetical protein